MAYLENEQSLCHDFMRFEIVEDVIWYDQEIIELTISNNDIVTMVSTYESVYAHKF